MDKTKTIDQVMDDYTKNLERENNELRDRIYELEEENNQLQHEIDSLNEIY